MTDPIDTDLGGEPDSDSAPTTYAEILAALTPLPQRGNALGDPSSPEAQGLLARQRQQRRARR